MPENGPGSRLATTREGVVRRTWKTRDRLRARELERRLAAGVPEHEAWLAVVTDASLGLKKWRGATSVPIAALSTTLARFYARILGPELEESCVAVRRRAAAFAPKAWGNIQAISDGDFGEGKVRTSTKGVTTIEIDSAAASVQLQANKLALEVAGIIERKGTSVSVTAQAAAAAQAVAGPDPYAILDALEKDPESAAALTLLARKQAELSEPPKPGSPDSVA